MLLIIEDNLDPGGVISCGAEIDLGRAASGGHRPGRAATHYEGGFRSARRCDFRSAFERGNVEVSGRELFTAMRLAWPQTRIIVVSADIVWCAQFQGVADACGSRLQIWGSF